GAVGGVVVPAAAEEARPARDLEAAEHAVADRAARHAVAGRDDLADVLVPDREAGLDLHAAVEDVEVGAAHAGRGDADDGVVRGLELGLGLVDDGDLVGRLEGNGLHGGGTLATHLP